jgi:hypothetical protein
MKAPLPPNEAAQRAARRQSQTLETAPEKEFGRYFVTKLIGGLGLALAVLAAVGAVMYRSTNRLVETTDLALQSQQALNALGTVQSDMKDAETGQRGYLLTGNEQYLEPYRMALKKVTQDLGQLRQTVTDAPGQRQQLQRLESLLADKLAELKQTVALRQRGDREAALRVVQTNQGQQLMDQIRKVIQEMELAENELLGQRSEAANAEARQAILTLSFGVFLNLVILGLVSLLIHREMARRKRVEQELKQQADEISDLYNQAPCGYHSLDENGTFLRINDTELRWLGYRREEVIGRKRLTDLLTPDSLKVFAENFPRFKQRGWVKDLEFELIRCDGTVMSVLLNATAVKDAAGRFVASRSTIFDMTERKRAEDALRASEARTRAMIDNMLGGLITTDSRGRIESLNPAAERIFGYTSEELIGQPVHLLVPEAASAAGDDFLKAAYQRAIGRITEWAGRRKNGEAFPFELSLFEFRTPAGRHFAGSIRDVSERHEVERLKKEFVSTVSHELRTPLTSIRGSLGLLAGGALGELPAEAKEVIEIAERNTIRLISLINDILDLERLESGKLEMRFAPTLLASVLARSLEAVRAFADQQTVALEAGPSSAMMLADEDRLVQVMVNLLSNAVKFSPAGSTVAIVTKETPRWVEVRVKDSGRGIPEAHLGAIFERFKQLEASDARQKGGTGLGLAICKAIIEQHQGTIGVESEEGQGSTFWFRVPAAPSERKDRAVPAARPILVCEDEPELRRDFERTLRREGYEVVLAASAEDAWQLLNALEVSLAVLDVELPGRSGLALLEEVRSSPRLKNLPVIMVAGKDPRSPERFADRLVAFLPTPIQEEQLLEAIREYLENQGQCEVLLVDDDAALLEVMARQLSQVGITVCTAATGREAVARAREKPPGLLVLDIGLPDGDGFEVVETLQQDPHLKEIPLLVYTGLDLTGEQRHRLNLGPTRFLTKSKATDEEFKALVVELLCPTNHARSYS